jgi:hypothetical protein
MNYDLSSMVFLVVLSFLPAVVDSCLGMGYGFTVTPLLLVLGFSPIQAIPAVLFSSLVGNLLSAYFHHQFKNVDFSADSIHLRISLIMGGLGSIGSLVGALVAIGISTFYLNLRDLDRLSESLHWPDGHYAGFLCFIQSATETPVFLAEDGGFRGCGRL